METVDFDGTDLLYNSLKETDDQMLITELIKRGYNLWDLRKNKTTPEIVKIG